ncbi:unnamed protein product [Adineta ricciae]|uniref:Uncharacterized protein n=1 Tax=Adineta ricciae TaxID=249248 RepID=A0A815NUV9_ADIRI|nr:unnamed protein product [Adineta ricciae]CAF1438582.1 unnamed protein product [Adineta ricciae]
MDKATIVYVRLVFLRIGEIDTLNEKYQAHASIESRWFVPADKFTYILSSDDQLRLRKDKSVLLDKYAECCWHPEIYIENSLGDLKEQIKYSAKLGKDVQMIQICEHRVIKGSFWEKLELQHFPSDVQDLSISVASMFYHDKVILIADPLRLSGVNREAFVDQQEWSLYEHVDTKQRFIKEFVFRTDDAVENNDDEIDDQQMKEVPSSEDRKRSILTVTCHAARQSQYFFWNGYCLILLITMVSFCTFGIPLQYAVNRLQVSCTLLLTSITFRWTVNRSLPTISYLTSLDRYGIAGIFNLVFHSLWHSTLSAIIWQTTPDYRVPKHSWIEFVDHSMFGVFVSVFIIYHLAMIIWLYCVPLKYRRRMKQKDVQYRILMQEKIRGNINRSLDSENSRPSTAAHISIEQL